MTTKDRLAKLLKTRLLSSVPFLNFLIAICYARFPYPKSVPPVPERLMERLENMDPTFAHQWTEGKPVVVKTGFYIESLSSINPMEMAFDVDLYLRQSWVDKRLMHDEKRHFTVRDGNLTNLLWTPDLYFSNAKISEYQWVTKPNIMMLIYPDGHVHMSSRVISTVACNLNLRNYPLDTQECEIRIMSYAYTSNELRIEWFADQNVLSYNKEIQLPEMTIQGSSAEYCNGTYTYGQTAVSDLTDNFSCLVAKLYFQREIGYHLVQTYIPTLLIVIISWISFWIDPAAIPARISLSFTTLLTLATMTAGIRTALPPVSYAKAIDYWIGICILFVFGALLEFAFVSSFARRAAKLHQKIEQNIKSPTQERCGFQGFDNLPPIIVANEDGREGPDEDEMKTDPSESHPFVEINRPTELRSARRTNSADGGRGRARKLSSGKKLSVVRTNFDNNNGSHKTMREDSKRNSQQLLNPISPAYVRRGSRWIRSDSISFSRASRELPMIYGFNVPLSTDELDKMEKARKMNAKIAAWGDTVSRVLFPFLFLLFIVLYWAKFKPKERHF